MIRHVAMFTFKPDAPEETPASLAAELSQLPGKVPSISAYAYGADLGLREGNYDFAVIADFENEADFRTYVDHPDHVAFIQDHLRPVLAERVSIQIEIGGP